MSVDVCVLVRVCELGALGCVGIHDGCVGIHVGSWMCGDT